MKIYQGYRWIRNKKHPRSNRGFVKQSVLILEAKINRSLRFGEMVHHIDGNKLNDNPNNLEISNRSLHMRQHSPINIRWQKQRQYLTKRKRQAISLYKKGWNKYQIIKYMNMGAGTIRRYLNQESLI